MNYEKEVGYIKKKLIDLNSCVSCDNVNLEKFYQICTGLYYRLNSVVFALHSQLLESEKEDVTDNRTDSN